MSINKVNPGDRLAIKASTYNRFTAATLAHEAANDEAHRPSGAQWLVDILNTTTGPLEAFSSVRLAEPIVNPSANLRELRELTGFRASPVTDPLEVVRIAITQEAIGPGKIGRAMIFGVTPILELVVNAEEHTRAIAGLDGTIETADKGPLEILWRSPEGEVDRRAVVALTQAQGSEPAGWGRILGASPTLPNQYDYTIELVRWNPLANEFVLIPDTTVAAAINTLEVGNTGDGIEGNGVDADRVPDGFEAAVPVGVGAVVKITKVVEDLWAFSIANLVDGQCVKP